MFPLSISPEEFTSIPSYARLRFRRSNPSLAKLRQGIAEKIFTGFYTWEVILNTIVNSQLQLWAINNWNGTALAILITTALFKHMRQQQGIETYQKYRERFFIFDLPEITPWENAKWIGCRTWVCLLRKFVSFPNERIRLGWLGGNGFASETSRCGFDSRTNWHFHKVYLRRHVLTSKRF